MLYKVLKIGAGEVDRFVEVQNEEGLKLRIFDDSASAVENIEDTFILEEGKEYEMKFLLFGDVVKEYIEKSYAQTLKLELKVKEKVGKLELFLGLSDLGEVFVKVDEASKNLYEMQNKTGYFICSRVDLIQVNDKIHPEYK